MRLPSSESAIPRHARRAPGFGPVLLLAASLVWIPLAALLASAIGSIAEGGGAEAVLRPALGVLALGALRAALDAAGNRLAFGAARGALSEQRALAAAALAAGSPLDPRRPSAGHAASVLAEQAEAVVPYLSRFRPARLRAAVVPAAIWLVVLVQSWAAALVLLFAAPIIPVFMALIGGRARAASEAQLVELGGMNAFLLDRLRGLATIRTLGAVEATALRLRAEAEAFRARTMEVLRIAFLSSAVLELFSALGVAMVAVFVGFHLLGTLPWGAWGGQLGLGQGMFLLLLAPAFFEPLRDLASAWHDRAAGEAALAALGGLAAPAVALVGGPDAGADARTAGEGVRVEGLRFRHPGAAAAVLDGIDLAVAPGEHVALLAPSGGGKSTLLALLAGLAEPEAGRILIGGAPLGPETAASLRRKVAWIGQRPHIFAGSLRDNVTLGRPLGNAAVRAALAAAGLAGVARNRGAAPIGENGLGLSGGEASRLALARLAATPEAWLVLADEPTAHLDAATAEAVAEALTTFARGRTLIVATHDPRLAARMHRVLRLAPEGIREAA